MDLNNKQKRYLEFASNIHFFEFIQEEFKKPHFKVEKYENEIEEISSKKQWDVEDLAKLLRENPKSYEIFEEVFQLARFTNTQLIHFLFDTDLLNSTNKDKLIEYLKQNLTYDSHFFDIFIGLLKKNELEQLEFKEEFKDKEKLIKFIDSNQSEEIENYLITLLKSSVFKYAILAVKKVEIIHDRLTNENFLDVSKRMAKYLIENLKLNDILNGIRLEDFLKAKRIPIDTKSIHGNFGKIKITSILKKHGFIDGNTLLDKSNINTLPHDLSDIPKLGELKRKFVFVTERYIEKINKVETGKPKKFDFILIYDLKPKILIETNFYSTAWTKIGINQGEYVGLNDNIKKYFKQFIFMWITDGNYWLTPTGKNMLLDLYEHFGDNILNYNLFDKKLEDIKETLMK